MTKSCIAANNLDLGTNSRQIRAAFQWFANSEKEILVTK